jgi:hypothetical protein
LALARSEHSLRRQTTGLISSRTSFTTSPSMSAVVGDGSPWQQNASIQVSAAAA